MMRGADGAHLDAALNPALLEDASELNTLPQEEGGEEADEVGTAAAAAARPLAATTPADTNVARRVVARWRALVAERKGVLLLRLLALPDLIEQEVLKRLDPVDRWHHARAGGAAVAGGSAGLGARAIAEACASAAPARGVLHVR